MAFPSAAQTRWGLKWVAPEECLGPADLGERVEQKLGHPVFGADSQFRVEGRLQKGSSPLWKARVTVVSSAGEVMGFARAGERRARLSPARRAPRTRRCFEHRPHRGAAARGANTAAPAMVVDEAFEEPTQAPEGSVFLHIDSPSKKVRLQRYLGTSTGTGYGAKGAVTVTTFHFSEECRAPCDRAIPKAEQRFYIGGDGVTMAGPIVLIDHQRRGRVNMAVRPGSATAQLLGWTGAGLFGLGGIGGGIGMLLVGSPSGDGYSYRAGRPEFIVGGLVTLLAGVTLGIIGIVIGVNNATRVTFPDETR